MGVVVPGINVALDYYEGGHAQKHRAVAPHRGHAGKTSGPDQIGRIDRDGWHDHRGRHLGAMAPRVPPVAHQQDHRGDHREFHRGDVANQGHDGWFGGGHLRGMHAHCPARADQHGA